MGTYKKPNRPVPHNSRRSTQSNSRVEIITLDSTTHMTFAEASAFSAKRSNKFNLQLTAAVNRIVDDRGGKPAEVPTIQFVRGLQNYAIVVMDKTSKPFAKADYFTHNQKIVPEHIVLRYNKKWVVVSTDDLRSLYVPRSRRAKKK